MNEPLKPNEYRCAMCGNVYEKEWTDEEALAETSEYWPGVPQEECAIVCDDCWQNIHPDDYPDIYQMTKELKDKGEGYC